MATPTEVAVGALQRAGLTVAGYGDWRRRSAGSFNPRGIMLHHDASAVGPSPGVRNWLATQASYAPAAHFWVDSWGVWWVITNGRANHAGRGDGWGTIPPGQGNYASFGVETDHTVNEAWPAAVYASLIIGFAVICDAFRFDPTRAITGHREYAPRRKIDPAGIVMGIFRSDVITRLTVGSIPTLTNGDSDVPALSDADRAQIYNNGSALDQLKSSVKALTDKVEKLQADVSYAHQQNMASQDPDTFILANATTPMPWRYVENGQVRPEGLTNEEARLLQEVRRVPLVRAQQEQFDGLLALYGEPQEEA